MATLEKCSQAPARTASETDSRIDHGLRRLGLSLTRTVSETAGAFFCVQASPETVWEAPLTAEADALHCSQKNLGEKYELICGLSADRLEIAHLFPKGASEAMVVDAYCELANCICGAILADAGFADEFGYLIPCVPRPGMDRLPPGSRMLRGAFSLQGAWIRFSLAVRQTSP